MATNRFHLDAGPGALFLGFAIEPANNLLVVPSPDALQVVWPLAKIPHALLMGATGGGKTSLLRVLVWYVVTGPLEVAVCLADGIPDADSFRMFAGQPRVAGIASGKNETAAMIEGVYTEYRRRLTALGNARQQAYDTRRRPGWAEPSRLILTVDEYLLFILDVPDTKRAATRTRLIQMLREMGLNGRKVNIHLLLAMQRAAIKDADAGLPSSLKAQLKMRLAATGEAGMDSVEARVGFDTDAVADLVPMIQGGGFARTGRAEVGFQVPWLPDVTDPKLTASMTDRDIAEWWAMLPRSAVEATAAAAALEGAGG